MNTIATSTGLSFYIVKALLEESYDTKEENKQIIEKYLSQYGLCVEQWRKDYYSLTGTEVICKRYVDLFDKKTAYIIGYFIACGTHSAKSRFAVYISNKNMYVKDTVQEYVKDVLGPSISWQELKNKEAGVTGNIKSPVIAAFLKDIIAGNKNSRTIPQIYFYADKDVQYELLRGILDGNCYIDQKEHYGTARFNSVNINLTLQVKTLLYFFGVPTTLTYLKRENDGCLLNIPYSPITAKMFNMDNDLGSILLINC